LPKSTHCFRAHSPIIDLEVLSNDTIVFATKNSGIRIVDKNDYTILSNILPQELEKAKMAVFSPDGKLVALVKSNTISIMILQTQVILKKITINNGTILTLHFDPSSHYLLIGTSHGRVLQYRYNSNTALSRLCSFPYYFPDEKPLPVKNNFVSAISFNQDTIACSGYGGTIYVMNLHIRNDKIVINRSRSKIETLCFIDDTTLVSGNIDGVLEVINLQKTKEIRRLNVPFTKIKHIVVMPNKEYVLVASDKNFISLVHIKTLKIIDSKYLEFEEKIQKLVKKDEKSILVVLHDRSVQNIELLNLGTLRKLIASNKLYKAYKLLQKAPMLRGSQEEKDLETKYQATIKKTINYMLQGDTFSAKELVKHLQTLPSKKEDIESIFRAFQHYEKFQLMFHEQKLNVAYAMCDKYPALQYTREYKSMEKKWHETCKKVEKEMISNNIESARVLLNDYLLVNSKRTLIQFILYKNKEFISFLQAIKNKEFKQINDLTKEHQTFASLQYYQSLHEEFHNKLIEAQRLIQVGNTHLAQVIIDELDDNPKYEDTAQTLQFHCNTVEQLYKYYNDDKLLNCYTLLDKNHFLKSTDLGIHLEKKWHHIIKKCEIYALKGQLKKIEKELGKLKQLVSRGDKIGDLLRLAQQKKIAYFLQKKEFSDACSEIQQYTILFGLDTEINSLISEYVTLSKTKLNLTADQARRKPRDFWLFC